MLTFAMLLISLLICTETSPSPKFDISCTMKDTYLTYHNGDAYAEHTVKERPEGALLSPEMQQ